MIDQKISIPASFAHRTMTGAPKISTKGGATIISHEEYLQDITSTASWDITSDYIYPLNPGLSDSFPWLGTIAPNYEQYNFLSLEFIYKARVGSNTNGNVFMATQYDCHDAAFATKEEMINYAGAVTVSPWVDGRCVCSAARSRAPRRSFVRTGELSENEDLNLYDQGNFSFQGITGSAGTYLGDLLVRYTVAFYNPKANPSGVGYAYEVETKGTAAAPMSSPGSPYSWMPWNWLSYPDTKSITLSDAGLYAIDVYTTSGDAKVPTALTLTADANGQASSQIFSATAAALQSAFYYLADGKSNLQFAFNGGSADLDTIMSIVSMPLQMAANLFALDDNATGRKFYIDDMKKQEKFKRRLKKFKAYDMLQRHILYMARSPREVRPTPEPEEVLDGSPVFIQPSERKVSVRAETKRHPSREGVRVL